MVSAATCCRNKESGEASCACSRTAAAASKAAESVQQTMQRSPLMLAALLAGTALAVLLGYYFGPELARTVKMHQM
jgi:hypothetical protein